MPRLRKESMDGMNPLEGWLYLLRNLHNFADVPQGMDKRYARVVKAALSMASSRALLKAQRSATSKSPRRCSRTVWTLRSLSSIPASPSKKLRRYNIRFQSKGVATIPLSAPVSVYVDVAKIQHFRDTFIATTGTISRNNESMNKFAMPLFFNGFCRKNS